MGLVFNNLIYKNFKKMKLDKTDKQIIKILQGFWSRIGEQHC